MTTSPLTNIRAVGEDINSRLTSIETTISKGTVAYANKAICDENNKNISSTYLAKTDADNAFLKKLTLKILI